jgi:threonine synthase
MVNLLCPRCDAKYPLNHLIKRCTSCGSILFVEYDYDVVTEFFKRKKEGNGATGLWRYRELLPLPEDFQQYSLGEGGTFLQRCDRLAKMLGVHKLYIKNEAMNPTGSFIDRGVAVEISYAAHKEVKEVYCAPTGNLGASLAAYTAKAGIKCFIHISSDINPGKLLQMLAYNAQIKLSQDCSPEVVGEGKLWVMPFDPFILEGEKTLVFEICEQLGWKTPRRIIAPMGTGGLLTMVWKGLNELKRVKLIEDRFWHLIGVQAKGCAPIVKAFEEGCTSVKPASSAQTIAVDLKVAAPPLGDMALEAIKKTHGLAIAVSDEEILEATRLLARTEGIFAEPAAASTIAALRKLIESKDVDTDEEVACIITGAGLKDPSATFHLIEKHRKIRFLVEQRRLRGGSIALGETKTALLKLIDEGNIYGYEIWKQLSKKYGIKIKVPSVYQHLSDLEALGLIEKGGTISVAGKPERRCYFITGKGKSALNALRQMNKTRSEL